MNSELALTLPEDFDWPSLLRRADRGEDWVNHRRGSRFVRLFTVGSRRVLLSCGVEKGSLVAELSTFDGSGPTRELRGQAERMLCHLFALDLDWPAVRRHLCYDAALQPHVHECRDFRPFRSGSLFEALIDAVVGQQVNVAFAQRLRNRLVEEFGASQRVGEEVYYAFPTPTRLARGTVALLRELQLSARKAEYILGLARRFQRPFALNGSDQGDVERLTQLRGIGQWSAEYALMQGAGALDIVPAGDLGLQVRIQRLTGSENRPSEQEVRARAEAWRPWRSVASYFLWYGMNAGPDLACVAQSENGKDRSPV